MGWTRKVTYSTIALVALAFGGCCKDAPPTPDTAPTAAAKPAATPSATIEAKALPAETAANPAGGGAADSIPDIPEGRSKPPTVAEWNAAASVNTQDANSRPDECFMKIVREWLKVNCSGKVTGVVEMADFGTENGDYFQSVREGKMADFVLRLRKGHYPKVRILRSEKGNAVLFVNWPPTFAKPNNIALGRAN